MSVQPSSRIRSSFSILLTSLVFISLSAFAQIPASQHIVLVIEENHNYSQVLASMPWLVAQGQANGYATNYFAESGGSLKDYLWLASGSCHSSQTSCTLPPGTNSYGCTGDSCTSPILDNNIFREMINAGITWKVYAQSYSAASGVAAPGGKVETPDGANSTSYYRRHNGVTWYSDILSHEDSQGGYPNLVDFSQFATDLANNALPQFSIIAPDGAHDAHDSCNDTVLPKQIVFSAWRRWAAVRDLRRMRRRRQQLQSRERIHGRDWPQGDSRHRVGNSVSPLERAQDNA